MSVVHLRGHLRCMADHCQHAGSCPISTRRLPAGQYEEYTPTFTVQHNAVVCTSFDRKEDDDEG